MRIESELLTEGLFGQVLIWMLELVPYLDQLGQKPEWILRSRNYGQPPGFNIFPSIITTTYEPGSESGASAVSFERLLQTVNHDYRGDFHFANRCWQENFRFTGDVYEQLRSFCSQCSVGETTLGVHYRGTDKNTSAVETNPVTAAEFISILRDFMATRPDVNSIFVASDDFWFAEAMKDFASDEISILSHQQPRSKDGRPLFKHHDVSANEQFAKQAILDCLTLSRCRYVLSCTSALSAFAKILNPDLEAYRATACKPVWFPIAYIPRYRGSDEATRKLLIKLQMADWEGP